MTLTARIVGGILAIAGGAIMLIVAFLPLFIVVFENPLFPLINPICGGVILIGGIILLKDKAVGGIMAIIGSIVFLILNFIPALGFYLAMSIFHPFPIESILAIVGAIIGLKVGSEFQQR
jgi:hypothetical protein